MDEFGGRWTTSKKARPPFLVFINGVITSFFPEKWMSGQGGRVFETFIWF